MADVHDRLKSLISEGERILAQVPATAIPEAHANMVIGLSRLRQAYTALASKKKG
jgi:hypothetical protein